MTKKRKQITMLVTVSVPAERSPAFARKEVRYLINDGAGYITEAGEEVKVIKVRPAKSKVL